jgi:two-component system, NarL family, nitrate/nitrite response regulator NarL
MTVMTSVPGMSPAVHLFLSVSEVPLPRWLEAFPTAVFARLGAKFHLPANTAVVWLRLTEGELADQQITAVRSQIGSLPLLILSNMPSDEEALACFSASARGYCNAHATAENLQQVASVVLQGGLWIGETLMQRLLMATSSRLASPVPELPNPLTALTEREQMVAKAVATGASNKEIARQLGITERTIKAHVGAILEKLQVRDRLQLALRLTGHRPD